MFGALKPGFPSLAVLKLVVNVVGNLNRKEQLRHRAVSLRQHGFLCLLGTISWIIVPAALTLGQFKCLMKTVLWILSIFFAWLYVPRAFVADILLAVVYGATNCPSCCWLLLYILYAAAMLVTNFWPLTVAYAASSNLYSRLWEVNPPDLTPRCLGLSLLSLLVTHFQCTPKQLSGSASDSQFSWGEIERFMMMISCY